MQNLNALFLTSHVTSWLANSHYPRILHIFDRACNLINEHREVLSIVTPQIGNAPFNLVIEDNILFPDHLNLESSISISPNQLILGNLIIHTAGAEAWNPHPDWEMLHTKTGEIANKATELPIRMQHPSWINYSSLPQFPNSLVSNLCSSFITTDISTAKSLSAQLAGLGIGLTPSGDDFIMGALYASWIIHPHEIASQLALEISEATAPLTTSLSATWLRSAGKGEAGILWHELFDALASGHNIQLRMAKLLAVGETSGADALAGFIGTFISYAEVNANPCPF